uniref:Uncharacterized protein n=1 Tax=Rhipicephalus appendiculatus TaxID=34631 RepID=A0A131YE02_RHIAP
MKRGAVNPKPCDTSIQTKRESCWYHFPHMLWFVVLPTLATITQLQCIIFFYTPKGMNVKLLQRQCRQRIEEKATQGISNSFTPWQEM